jgi:hypothetical protein
MVRKYVRKRAKRYSDQQLALAIKEVSEEGKNLSSAALKYNIPKSTLSEHCRNVHPMPTGRACILSAEEEELIAKCLIYAANCGWPMDRVDLKEMVRQYCKEAKIETPWNTENGPGVEFLRNFEKRWACILTKRKTVSLTYSKAHSLNKKVINDFFNVVENAYIKGKLHESPAAIYNLDETGFGTDPSGAKCFFRRGDKETKQICPGNDKKMFTVLVCGNADGSVLLPPFIIYKSVYLHSMWCQGAPTGSTFASSHSGWMEAKLFEQWMVKFMEHKHAYHGDNLIVLILDGHASHLSFTTASLCLKNNVSSIYLGDIGLVLQRMYRLHFILLYSSFYSGYPYSFASQCYSHTSAT